MNSRSLALLVGLAFLGCGGTQTKGTSANGASGSDPEKDCLAAAASHAEPKPDAPNHITVSQIVVRHAELAHPDGATRTNVRERAKARKPEQPVLNGSWPSD